MWKRSSGVLLSVALALLVPLTQFSAAHAQQYYFGIFCPGQWVPGGGGQICQCPDGSYPPMGTTSCGGSRQPVQPQEDPFPVKCGTYSCKAGNYCGSRNTCVREGDVDCYNGKSCGANSKCSRDGTKCLSPDAVDCGTHACSGGQKCGSGNRCLATNAVDCGGGKSCPAGTRCLDGGQRCLTADQIASEKVQQQKARLDDLNQQRLASNQPRQKTLAEANAECNLKRITDIANGGTGGPLVCLGSNSGNATSTPTAPPPAQQPQLDFLRRNATSLQPEAKLVPPSVAPGQGTFVQPPVTGFGQEITPNSELGRMLAQEAEAYKKKRAAELAEMEAQQRAYEEEQRQAQKMHEKAQRDAGRRLRESGAAVEIWFEVDSKDDCLKSYNIWNRLSCPNGGVSCVRQKITRNCEKRYVAHGLIPKSGCGAWTNSGTPQQYCKIDQSNLPEPNFCELNGTC